MNRSTIRITLTNPWPSFLQVLADQGCWIFPMELLQHHGEVAVMHPVGTGPFKLKRHVPGESIILERNANYWGKDEEGNALPFLDGIRYTFVKDKMKELEAFEKGHLSAVYELPVERTGVLKSASEFQVQTVAGLTAELDGFNMRKAPFTDVRVRKAFSMAIDRQLIVDSVLNGLAVPADRGVVAPGFEAYPYTRIPKAVYDPVAAESAIGGSGLSEWCGSARRSPSSEQRRFRLREVSLEWCNPCWRRTSAFVSTTTVVPANRDWRLEMGHAQFWREGWGSGPSWTGELLVLVLW